MNENKIYKEYKNKMKISPVMQQGDSTNAVVYSFDLETSKFSYELKKNGEPFSLATASDVNFVLRFGGSNPEEYPTAVLIGDVEDRLNGKVSFVMPKRYLGFDGRVLGEVNIQFTNGQSLTAGHFSFLMKPSYIDDGVEIAQQVYVERFEDLINIVENQTADLDGLATDVQNKTDEIKDLIVQNDVLKKAEAGSFEEFREQDDTIISKMKNEFTDRGINVKWFGAKCDGVTDDSAAIQKAIDFAILNKFEVILGPFEIAIRKTIKIPSGLKLKGSGINLTKIKSYGLDNTFELESNSVNTYIEKLSIINQVDKKDKSAFKFDETAGRGYLFKNIYIQNFENMFLGKNLLWYSSFDTIRGNSCGFGLNFSGQNNLANDVTHFYFDRCEQNALKIGDWNGTFTSCNFGGLVNDETYPPNKFAEISVNSNVAFIGCNFEHSMVNEEIIIIKGQSKVTFLNCNIWNHKTKSKEKIAFIGIKDGSRVNTNNIIFRNNDTNITMFKVYDYAQIKTENSNSILIDKDASEYIKILQHVDTKQTISESITQKENGSYILLSNFRKKTILQLILHTPDGTSNNGGARIKITNENDVIFEGGIKNNLPKKEKTYLTPNKKYIDSFEPLYIEVVGSEYYNKERFNIEIIYEE